MKNIEINKPITNETEIARLQKILGRGRSSTIKLANDNYLRRTAQITAPTCRGEYRRPNGEIVNKRDMRQQPGWIFGVGCFSSDYPGEDLEPVEMRYLEVEVEEFRPGSGSGGNCGGH